MQGKIALEEHFAIPDTLQDSAGFLPESYWPELKRRLLDIQDKRLAQMDEHGVEMMILSLNAPAVQAIPDASKRQRNSAPGERLSRRAGRQASDAFPGSRRAADAGSGSRDRANSIAASTTLGFKRRAGQRLLAGRRRRQRRSITTSAILAVLGRGRAARRAVLPASAQSAAGRTPIYEGHPWLLGPTWAFGQETAVHALRLMGSGPVRSAIPRLQIILGHMGEGLPYSMWRVDNRNGWVESAARYTRRRRRSASTSTPISI